MYMLMSSKCTSYGIVFTVSPVVMLIIVFFIIGSAQYATAFSELVSSLSPKLTDQAIVNYSDDNKITSSSSSIDNTDDTNGTPTIVTVSNNRSFLSDATHSISLDPATTATTTNSNSSISNIITKDNGAAGANKVSRGTILSFPRSYDSNYLVTQLKAPEGYVSDKLSKIVQISANQSQKSSTATFSNDNAINQDQQRNNNSSQIKSITYTPKFECGSIVGSEGPLRPGHYDTDISIFNRQEYPINMLLDIVINGSANKTNSIIKTMQPQTSTAIVCKDIRQVLGMGNNNSKGLIEGFVTIHLDVNGGILNSLSSTIGGVGSSVISSSPVTINDINNFLDVNVFYTANALESLPHEILVKDIAFSILNDTSSKIPRSLLMKPLDITVQSQFNEISDPESKVKEILSKEYNLLSSDLPGLRIQILNQSIGAAAMIDDHAISSSVVRPQASS
jgi:hypothetical protein